MANLSRRQTLKLLGGAGALFAAGLWPGRLRADDGKAEDFRFLEVNDLHVIDDHCLTYQSGVVAQMKATPKAEFCLVVGDLADVGAAAALAGVRDVYKGLAMPFHCVMGNHDWAGFNDRKAYLETFPDPLNYTFDHRGWQFVGIDSTDHNLWAEAHVQKETLQWLADTVPTLDKKRPLVLFTHFPMGPRMKARSLNADHVLAQFVDHNLRAVLGGHYHGYQEDPLGDAGLITTDRCCSLRRHNHDGTKEKGYFVCQARQGTITREFVEYKG